MKRMSHAGYTTYGGGTDLMNELNMAVSRHVLNDTLTMLWANSRFYQLIGYAKDSSDVNVIKLRI